MDSCAQGEPAVCWIVSSRQMCNVKTSQKPTGVPNQRYSNQPRLLPCMCVFKNCVSSILLVCCCLHSCKGLNWLGLDLTTGIRAKATCVALRTHKQLQQYSRLHRPLSISLIASSSHFLQKAWLASLLFPEQEIDQVARQTFSENSKEDSITLLSVNIASLFKNWDTIVEAKANVFLLQETRIDLYRHGKLKQWLQEQKLQMTISAFTGQKASGGPAHGGTGIISDSVTRTMKVPGECSLLKTDRYCDTLLPVANGGAWMLLASWRAAPHSNYGRLAQFTAHQECTKDVHNILERIAQWEHIPVIIACDLN